MKQKNTTSICPGCGAVFKNWSGAARHGKFSASCTQEMRFWGRVNKATPTGCWIWLGCVDKWGYGDLSYEGKHLQAHRLAWKLLKGEPGDMHVLHKCDTPPCCNPDHLYLGTDLDNCHDRMRAGTQASGGKLSPEEIRSIRSRYVKHSPRRSNAFSLAKEFGVGSSTIYAIVNGKTWQEVR